MTLRLVKMALDKGIELIAGQLVDRKESSFQLSFAECFLKLMKTIILQNVLVVKSLIFSNYDAEKEVYTVKFSKDIRSTNSFKEK